MKMEQPRRRPVVAILGGGLSGAATAFHLARILPPQAIDIAVVEPREHLGRGLAYSTTEPAHRINVPASKMTLISSDLGHFMAWLAAERRTLSPGTLTLRGDFFPERQIFGEYVSTCLAPYLASGAIRHLRAAAVSAEPLQGGYLVDLSDGTSLEADLVVLAMTHPMPSLPAELRGIANSPRLIANPYDNRRIAAIGPTERVLDRRHRPHLGGRGGEPQPPRLLGRDRRALSPRAALARPRRRRAPERGGFRPASGVHRPHPGRPHPFGGGRRRRLRAQLAWHSRPGARAGPGRLARALGRRARAAGPAPPRLLGRAPLPRRAAGRGGPRRPGRARQAHLSRRTSGRAPPRRRTASPSNTAAVARPTSCSERFDSVVVTTGPSHAEVVTMNPVLRSMATAGLLCPDPLGLGLMVADHCRAVDASGAVSSTLFVAGPLARGHVGELMGVPEVIVHAETVAHTIAAGFSAQRQTAGAWA